MAEIQPMEQFLIKKLVPIPAIPVPGVGLIDLSITNSVATMMFAAALISVFFLAAGRRQVVPGRLQAFGEILYDLADKGLTGSMIGDRGRPFLPYVFALFSIIAVLDIWGLIPSQFTVTSQLSVTISLALLTFVMVVIVGFVRNGIGFFKLFVPHAPWYLLILLVPIELISFATRPISLSVRLFANMLAGHTMLKVFASFVIALGGATAVYLKLMSIAPMLLIVAITALELLVAFLQAYVFAILTCIYLNEALHLHEQH